MFPHGRPRLTRGGYLNIAFLGTLTIAVPILVGEKEKQPEKKPTVVVAALEPLPTPKQVISPPSHLEFDSESPHARIGAKGLTGELETTDKAQSSCRGHLNPL